MGSPTIRLHRLGLKAFRSYVDKQELVLPQSGLHLIDAPSGHGKSGLAEGIAFALDYSQFPATEHQSWSWLTEESMEVELDFLVGVSDASIRRGKKPSLKLGDQKPMTAASAIAKRLPEVLGIKPEMLQALTYRPQRQRGLLLSMGDTEKKVFLTELLHLGQTEEEVERTQKNLGKLEKDLEVLRALADQAARVVPAAPAPAAIEDLAALMVWTDAARQAADVAGKRLREATDRVAALRREQEGNAAAARQRHEEPLRAGQRAIEAARRQVYQVDPAAAEKLAKLKVRLKFIQDGMAKLRSDHQAKSLRLREELDAQRRELWRCEQRAAELPGLRRQHETLTAEIAVLEGQKCPTCEQAWVTENAKKTLERKMTEADEVEERIKAAARYEDLSAERASVANLEAEARAAVALDPVPQKFYDGEREQQTALGALQQEQLSAKQRFDADRAAQVAKLSAEYEALALRRDQDVVAAQAPSAAQKLAEEDEHRLSQEAHRAEMSKLEAEAKLQAARARNEAEQRRYDGDHARWAAAKQAADGAAARAAETENSMRAEEDFWSLLKSFLNLVFDETLQCVAARANELLVGVPNVAGLTLDFASERETKSGTVRQEIKLVVRKDGHEIPFRSGCSGGQQAVIELAVDLALAEVIAERTGVYPGWLVLDEPFDGLGAADKEACMEVLSRVAQDRAIFVIDHTAEVKSSFDSVIAVKYADGRSTLTYVA